LQAGPGGRHVATGGDGDRAIKAPRFFA
jgi:hypothetical protein